MHKGRLEAFSDGVIAIIITIMVLELKAPDEGHSLWPLWPTFVSYVLSFIYVGIYWNNHHHLWQLAHGVNGRALWANLHLLFWLSLLPFATSWMGNSHFSGPAVTGYGVILFLCAAAWSLMALAVKGLHAEDAAIHQALSKDKKERASLLIYLIAVAVANWVPPLACLLYLAVAAMWFIPDLRFERAVRKEHDPPSENQAP